MKYKCSCGVVAEITMAPEGEPLRCVGCRQPIRPQKSFDAPRDKSADDLLSEILGARS